MQKYSTRLDESYSEDEDNQENAPFQFYEHITVGRTLVYYICGTVGEPQGYIEMIHRIRTAGPQDVVYIHLNTQGGSISTGIQIINAMQTSAAKIITVLDSEAHSLGTLLLLAGDEYIINDNCRMMFHNFSAGMMGKGNELNAQIQSTIRWFNKVCRQIYLPFLSEDELDSLIRGEDFWFDSDEIKKRLNRIVKDYEQHEIEKQEAKAKPRAKKLAVKSKPKAKKAKTIAEEHTPNE